MKAIQFKETTPRQAGFYMPAEWTQQEGILLSWPTNPDTWTDCWDGVQERFAEIALTIARFETVWVNAAPGWHGKIRTLLAEVAGRQELSHPDAVQLLAHPTNDVWCRDHGPTILKHRQGGELAMVNWEFDAWGGKFASELDNQVPERLAKYFGWRSFKPGIVMEGGSIEVNGVGDVLTTTSCLLNQNRNAHLTQAQLVRYLEEYLGVSKVHWLGDGIEGDDTDGHIDDLARFTDEDTVMVAFEEDRKSVNYQALQDNREHMEHLKSAAGGGFKVLEMHMPEVFFHAGRILPASYVNFLILNGAVLMPTFRQSDRDQEALWILEKAFPGREVIGIDCYEIVRESGTLHCISQQVPVAALR